MTLDEQKINELKERLVTEQTRLEAELATVAVFNEETSDWELKPDNMDIMEADRNEVADRLEDLQDNAAILNDLEIQLNRVKRALGKIDAGTYGRCEVSGEEIPIARLEANPAALTTVEHETELHK